MKSLYEKLNISKNTKVNKSISYSFYNDRNDVEEGDKVLFACKCGDGDGVFVKCIVDKIIYSKFDSKITDKIFHVNLKLDSNEPGWIKEDSTITKFIDEGVSGYKIDRQLLKLE